MKHCSGRVPEGCGTKILVTKSCQSPVKRLEYKSIIQHSDASLVDLCQNSLRTPSNIIRIKSNLRCLGDIELEISFIYSSTDSSVYSLAGNLKKESQNLLFTFSKEHSSE